MSLFAGNCNLVCVGMWGCGCVWGVCVGVCVCVGVGFKTKFLIIMLSPITAIPDASNYVKVCEAVQVLCHFSLHTIQACVEAWLQSHRLKMQTCRTPSKCPSYKKPIKKSGACQACIDWGKALELECYPPGKDIQWRNVNATLLHKDPVEAAKGFAFIIPDKQSCTEFGDLDIGGILKLMMGFADYHEGDQICHDKIQRVQAIRRNKISVICMGHFYLTYILKTLVTKFKKIICCTSLCWRMDR